MPGTEISMSPERRPVKGLREPDREIVWLLGEGVTAKSERKLAERVSD